MAKIVQVVALGITLVYLPIQASPTNWFLDAPRALFGLAGSASASAFSPPTPASYISDLRKKQEKSEQLLNDKDVMEEVNVLDRTSGEGEGSGAEDSEDEEKNEASPSLLEKKVGKILTKLRLIAQIKNAYHYRPEIHEHETNIPFTTPANDTVISVNPNKTNEVSTNTMKVEDLEPNLEVTRSQASENIQSIRPPAVYGTPKEPFVAPKSQESNGPTKIEFDIDLVSDKLEDLQPKNDKLREQEPGRFGTLGVFFAELLGSIVGLGYGAIAQITSGTRSPVAVSTSEGL